MSKFEFFFLIPLVLLIIPTSQVAVNTYHAHMPPPIPPLRATLYNHSNTVPMPAVTGLRGDVCPRGYMQGLNVKVKELESTTQMLNDTFEDLFHALLYSDDMLLRERDVMRIYHLCPKTSSTRPPNLLRRQIKDIIQKRAYKPTHPV